MTFGSFYCCRRKTMYHELRGCIPQYRLRFLEKKICVAFLSLPIATLICMFLFSTPASLKETYFKAESNVSPETNLLAENILLIKKQNGVAEMEKPNSGGRQRENAVQNGRAMYEVENGFSHIRQVLPLSSFRRAKTNYTIHIWKHGERMKRRFLRSYGSHVRNPFEFCSVNNCIITTNDAKVEESDAVFFHLHQTKGPHTLPRYHPPQQIWIFFTDESPLHTFLATRRYSMEDYNGLFNWSMTYRSDSDVPVPYGRTVLLTEQEMKSYKPVDYARTKTRDISILGSNCGGKNNRWEYVNELQKHVNVDVYGRCGKLACPGHFTQDCSLISDYKFYLAFENSNCNEYITEKLWWNAFHKSTVPVVMGPRKSDYKRLCPPNSFIHVSDFQSPEDLAKYLTYLLANDMAYNAFFEWKKKYKVLNEHGYFGSPSLHICHVCETLNRKSPAPKIYTDLGSFWNSKSNCHKANWQPGK